MAHVKKELLEYLIRQCVREVLEQASEDPNVTPQLLTHRQQFTVDKLTGLGLETQSIVSVPEFIQNFKQEAQVGLQKGYLKPSYPNAADGVGNVVVMKKPEAMFHAIVTPDGLVNGRHIGKSSELRYVAKEDETGGAAAPPADGLGTAEQPSMPKKPSPFTPFNETKLKKEWVNAKEGKPLSPEINELKSAIKRIVREVFSE